MLNVEAYWISPVGKIMEVEQRHIVTICNHPEWFGLEKKYLEKIFKKHKEPTGWEGVARGEIMTELMKKNWIRVRYVERPTKWVIEFWQRNELVKNHILKFINIMIKKDKNFKFNDIQLNSVKSDSTLSYNVKEILKKGFFNA